MTCFGSKRSNFEAYIYQNCVKSRIYYFLSSNIKTLIQSQVFLGDALKQLEKVVLLTQLSKCTARFSTNIWLNLLWQYVQPFGDLSAGMFEGLSFTGKSISRK